MSDPRELISALKNSRSRLASLVEPLSPAQVAGPSYASEWSIAQVLSHLGSGAEVFGKFLDAGLSGGDPPTQADFPPIWDRWNAKAPIDQATDGLRVDAAFVARLDALTDDEIASLRLAMFGMEVDAARLLQMRLSEHAVHTWDVAVALDPSATLSLDATTQLVDTMGALVGRAGKPQGEELRISVDTIDPVRHLQLVATDTVALSADGEDGGDVEAAEAAFDGRVELPAEALIRLFYGRLDPGHTPTAVIASGVDLDVLRQMFPGF
jgi:uncharacterized protein (TIGR03083 family)